MDTHIFLSDLHQGTATCNYRSLYLPAATWPVVFRGCYGGSTQLYQVEIKVRLACSGFSSSIEHWSVFHAPKHWSYQFWCPISWLRPWPDMLQHLRAADNLIKQQEMDTSCELSRHMQAGSRGRSCFLFSFMCICAFTGKRDGASSFRGHCQSLSALKQLCRAARGSSVKA